MRGGNYVRPYPLKIAPPNVFYPLRGNGRPRHNAHKEIENWDLAKRPFYVCVPSLCLVPL